jgi:hypothetical protein
MYISALAILTDAQDFSAKLLQHRMRPLALKNGPPMQPGELMWRYLKAHNRRPGTALA